MQIKNVVLALTLVGCSLVACKKAPDNAKSQTADATQPNPSTQPSPSPQPGSTTAAAPAPEVPPPPPPPQPVVTTLDVRLGNGVSSKNNSPGDPFDATLAAPLVVDGKTIAPDGTRVSGTVTDAQKAGRFKGGATLDLALRSITLKGTVYHISTMTMNQTSKGKGKRTTAMIAGGAGGGAAIGAIAGGGKGAAIGALVGGAAGTAGAATGNRDISMPPETPASFQLSKAVTIQPESIADSQP